MKNKMFTMVLCSLLVMVIISSLKINPVYTNSDFVIIDTYAPYSMSFPTGRKIWLNQERFWAFYTYGSNLVYKTSTDGETWENKTTVREDVITGCSFATWVIGNYIHVIYQVLGSSDILWKRGTLNADGTITWGSEYVALTITDGTIMYPSFCVDSLGYPFIIYWLHPPDAEPSPYVTKSCSVFSWITQTGFPYRLTTARGDWSVNIVPLTNGQVYAIYHGGGPVLAIKGKLWSGSSWESEESISSKYTPSGVYYGSSSAVAIGDNIHYAFRDKDGNIIYTYRTDSTWSEDETLSTTAETSPVLAKYDTTLCVFYGKTDNKLYYRKRIDSSWGDEIFWYDYSADDIQSREVQVSYESGIIASDYLLYAFVSVSHKLYGGKLLVPKVNATTETRYMGAYLCKINGLYAYMLSSTPSSCYRWCGWAIGGFPVTSYFGIRVFVRHVDESETEITCGTPVAVVSRSEEGEGYQSNTWHCPEISLVSTDAIIVRVYHRFEGYDWDVNVRVPVITEQLGAESLDSATWTVTYHTSLEDYIGAGVSRAMFRWGDASHNSRITNFQWRG